MRIFFKSFGCRTNQVELESLKQHLLKQGFEISQKIPDFVVINSCCVTAKAEAEVDRFVRRCLREYPQSKIILTGCLTDIGIKELNPQKRIIIFKNSDKHRIYNFISGDTTELSFFPILGTGNRTRAFMKIQDGCDMRCSYCIVPYMRYKIASKKFEYAVMEFERLLSNGVKEVVLCGTRLGSYSDGDKKLADLLNRLVSIKGDFRIRLSSLEPWEIDEKLCDVMSDKKICRHLHIPLQSACDRILSLMKRPYTKKMFTSKIELIRKKIPDIAIYCDVIVGFPTETDEEFMETYNFVREMYISGLHCFPYSKRPYTEAFCLGELDRDIVRKRSVMMRQNDAYLRERFLESKKGKLLEVLVIGKKGEFFSALSSEFIETIIDDKLKVNMFERVRAVERYGKKLLCVKEDF
ncbi:MAG: MiaB/RimO family radical SAM methylthiotransferase [Elusimicrobiales bacterium]